ncbi:MAG: efflux RND transporter periplasmic adaptor subunit [Planctomycetota bacterium]
MKTSVLVSLITVTLLSSSKTAEELPLLDGLIEPSLVLELGLPVEGRLELVDCEVGDLIQAGDVVARLDSSVIEAQLKVAEARATQVAELNAAKVQYEHTKKRAEMYRDLFEKRTVSKEELEEVEHFYDQAKASLEQVQESLRIAGLECEQLRRQVVERQIVSPVTGKILDKLLSPGELVTVAEATVLKIAVLNPLYVEMLVPAELYGKISEGMTATVLVESPIKGRYPAVVRVVEPVIHAASGTFKVRLEVDNEDYMIPAGLRCHVRFGS